MDEAAPHVLGSTRKMEAEFRAKREAETAAVQRRRTKAKAKTLPPSPEDDSETASKKTGAKANLLLPRAICQSRFPSLLDFPHVHHPKRSQLFTLITPKEKTFDYTTIHLLRIQTLKLPIIPARQFSMWKVRPFVHDFSQAKVCLHA